MNPMGIMQGRLTRANGRGIQFFPFENWQKEFQLAADVGLQEIEFLFDEPNYQENPLWSDWGLNEIKSLIAKTKVGVKTICADFFLRRPFYRNPGKTIEENKEILNKLILAAAKLGARIIEIPLLDNSSLKSAEEEEELVAALQPAIRLATANHLTLSFETDLPPEKLIALIGRLDSPTAKITYDSGNSASLGYDCVNEFSAYGNLVCNVHIKDRVRGGPTIPLGSGDADFPKLFQSLTQRNYRGGFILQAARGQDGREKDTISIQTNFLKKYIIQYLGK